MSCCEVTVTKRAAFSHMCVTSAAMLMPTHHTCQWGHEQQVHNIIILMETWPFVCHELAGTHHCRTPLRQCIAQLAKASKIELRPPIRQLKVFAGPEINQDAHHVGLTLLARCGD